MLSFINTNIIIKGDTMSFASIISHMNEQHRANLVDLVNKFAGVSEVKDVCLKSVDLGGLDITYNNGENLRIDFPAKADEENLTNVIIELCMSAKKNVDYDKIKDELNEFKASFGSVCLATLNPNGEVLCSYAPIIQTTNGDYIYISETAEHYASIKGNPHNIEVLFLEDESKAASVIVRKRLRYRVKATFIERGAEFERVYDEFERKQGSGGGISTIRNFLDFHLIKLTYEEGRFVKGFGGAFAISQNGELKQLGGKGGGNPHQGVKNPHTRG